MKLEIKHIAPYLPYGLRIYYIGDYATLKGVDSNGTMCIDEDNEGCHFVNIDNIKPILRPLSDLTKEITINGETFVPYENLGYDKEYTITFYDGGRYFYVYRNGIHVVSPQGEMLDKLLEWHFDIFGLIPNGLAIDINTLDK